MSRSGRQTLRKIAAEGSKRLPALIRLPYPRDGKFSSNESNLEGSMTKRVRADQRVDWQLDFARFLTSAALPSHVAG